MQSKGWILTTIFLALCWSVTTGSTAIGAGIAVAVQEESTENPPSESPQEEKQQEPEEKQEEKSEEKQSEEEKSETEKQEDQGPDGPALLDQAFDLKLEAKTTKDLEKIADLCQKALKKGLDKEDEQQAKTLASSSLLEFADQLGKRIFSSGGRDRRWQYYRSQAIPRLKRALEFDESLIDAHLLLAKLQALPGGDRDDAEAAIEKAIELAVDDREQLSEALFVRASLAKDENARLADLNQAIKINPKNLAARQVRAAYFAQQGNPDKALEDYKAWLAEQPENYQARLLVANNLIAMGEKFDEKLQQEALQLVDEAIEAKPELTVGYTVKAQIYVIAEEPEKAIEAASKAIELEPKNIRAIRMRGSAYVDQAKYDLAMKDAEEILRLQVLSPEGLQLRGIIHIRQANFEKAIGDFKILAEQNPRNRALQRQIAALYDANYQPDEAIKIYDSLLGELREDVLESQPSEIKVEVYRDRAELLRGRGDAYLSAGKHAEAIKDYEAAYEFGKQVRELEKELNREVSQPDDGVLNNLAWVLATTPEDDLRNGERAIELAKEAAEVTEFKEAHILSTLASGYAETGDFETAIEWLEKALEVNRQVAEDAADKSATDRQFNSLNKELESYRNEKPWREKKDPAEERAKAEAQKQAAAEQEKSESQTDESKDEADKEPSEKQADKDDSEDGSDDSDDGSDDKDNR